MGSRLSPKDNDLYKAVDEVLHYLWDPIGVSGVPEARDEYSSYLPVVFGLLKNNASPETIAKYLFEIATDRMGLGGNPKRDQEVVSILIDWKDVIEARQG